MNHVYYLKKHLHSHLHLEELNNAIIARAGVFHLFVSKARLNVGKSSPALLRCDDSTDLLKVLLVQCYPFFSSFNCRLMSLLCEILQLITNN